MKTFYTEKDIQSLFKEGKSSLSLSADTILTDLGYEMAQRLGMKIITEDRKPPSAPERPYIAAIQTPGHNDYAGQYPSFNNQAVDVRPELVKINNELYQADLITATGGNISARVPGTPDQIWITPGSIFKGDLKPEMMVRIDLDGKALDSNFAYKASSERFVHCEVFRKRPDLHAVIHTHAPLATVLGLANIPFLPISTDSAFLGELTRVPFISPGTNDLGKAVAEAMAESFAVIMQNHGLVVGGKNLRQAADITLIVESTAKKILTSYMVGKGPLQLPPEAIEEFRKELRI